VVVPAAVTLAMRLSWSYVYVVPPPAEEPGAVTKTIVRDRSGNVGDVYFDASNRVVARLRTALGPAFPIIGVGGVTSPGDAIAKRQAGADIVQIYTGFIYEGPELVTRAARALAASPTRSSG